MSLAPKQKPCQSDIGSKIAGRNPAWPPFYTKMTIVCSRLFVFQLDDRPKTDE